METSINYTPENITSLFGNEIFVFGSNLNGNHAGGAARTAVDNFGAIIGQAEGLQGHSYAIPTLDKNMEKLPEDELKKYIANFFDFAVANPDKTFYLTKIGCGIAGYDTEYISAIVRSFDYPANVIFPKEFYKVKTYKIFNPDFTCRGFQYEVGKEYTHDGYIAVCNSGFHACENPFDALTYYPLVNQKGQIMKFAQVEQSGTMDCEDDKICSKRIRINAELNLAGFIKAGIEWIKNYTDSKKLKAISPTNNDNHDNSAQIGSSGGNAQIGSGGDYAQIGSSGDYAKIDSSGEDSVICCAGHGSIARAKAGSWITLAEWAYNEDKQRYTPKCVKTEYVDGERIKADTWYKLIDGQFTEQKLSN